MQPYVLHQTLTYCFVSVFFVLFFLLSLISNVAPTAFILYLVCFSVPLLHAQVKVLHYFETMTFYLSLVLHLKKILLK